MFHFYRGETRDVYRVVRLDKSSGCITVLAGTAHVESERADLRTAVTETDGRFNLPSNLTEQLTWEKA